MMLLPRSGLQESDGAANLIVYIVVRRMFNLKQSNKKLRAGRGGVGKSIVAGTKDRATNKISADKIEKTNREILHDFVIQHATNDCIV